MLYILRVFIPCLIPSQRRTNIQYIYYLNFQQKMMVDEALAEVITTVSEPKEAAFAANFDLVLDSELFEDVRAQLFQECLILTVKKIQHLTFLKISFNFDLIFELLLLGDHQQSDIRCPQPVGLKFERFQKSLTLKFKKPNKDLLQWRNFLQARINERGFHELFKPIKKIGKGNFATVYLVTRHEDAKKYAVKAFSKEGTYSEEKGKQSLINQIEIMRKFNHKNLMKLFGVFESQNSIYINVQILEGGQLYDKIKNRHKFTSVEIKLVMKGLLEGLQVMHANKIMHRDLKPENILLRKDNDYDVVIADFGLAESCDKDQYLFVRCGTPGYVAPQVVNLKDLKAKYSPICDMFSVGVIFHLLALRKSPFPGKQYDEVLSQNRACKINFEASQYHQLPDAWLNLMKRLLEKDPAKRITASEALNHEFFSKDNMFAEFNKERSSLHARQSNLPKEDIALECQSPLMTTKNNARKNPGLLREDSCLKFKMKENLMTGRTDQKGETIDEIDSPGFKKVMLVRNGVESRFKKMAKQ